MDKIELGLVEEGTTIVPRKTLLNRLTSSSENDIADPLATFLIAGVCCIPIHTGCEPCLRDMLRPGHMDTVSCRASATVRL